MIEQIMYFTLGVLIATLVALLVLPAVWHRAVRLTTKRVEAAVPISIFEVQADKDQQRAFFALNQRRLELQTDAMRETVVSHAATIETQRQKIFDLENTLKDITGRHELLTATGAERDVLLGEIQDQLADRTAALARTEAELEARTAALAALDDAHRSLDGQARELAAALAAREATLVSERARITVLESDVAALRASLADTMQRLEATTGTLETERVAAAEARIAAAEAATRLSADLAESQATLSQKTRESEERRESIATLEAERDRLSTSLSVTEGDLDASRAVVHAFEQRRATEFAAAEAENRRLADTLHMLRADHALMEDSVRRAGRENAEIPATHPAPEGMGTLRDSLSDVAARLVALTARIEGAASPVPGLVDGAVDGLAGRIRALLDAAPSEPTDEIGEDEMGEAPTAPLEAPHADLPRSRAAAQ